MNLPPYDPFPKISGEKISLRQIENDDIQDIIEISFYDGVKASSLHHAVELSDKIVQDYKDGNSIHWGIVDNLTHQIVGTCGYYRGLDKGEGELGCVLLPKYRGQGYMTTAMLLAINFGLNHIGLQRIWAITNQSNARAIKLMERLNFVRVNDMSDNEAEYELRM